MAGWPLVGRDEELVLFQDLLLEEGRGVVVVAPPGTGKTRLMQEAIQRVGEFAATELVVGTRSAQGLPLAAVAALLPDTAALPGELELFRVVRATLAERAGERPVVLAVDDAHLLDPVSATLVHHLAIVGAVRPFIAIRAGEPVEDAITALWRDGAAERMDLQPLGPDDVTVLLQTVLGGEVEAATAWRLWSVAGGNPLYLREVVSEALRIDTLADVGGGVWRWRGEVQVGARLRELVGNRLAVLDDDERDVVALLAVGDTVDQQLVETACEPRAVAALQGRGFVESVRHDTHTDLKLDHPLFAEVVRNAIPMTERARWCRFLADTVDPSAGDAELLQHVVWQIDGGIATDPELLLQAAERANSRFDGVLGERLAHAAVDAGGGSTARVVRAEACFQLGQFDEALVHVSALEDADLSDELLARLAYVLAEAGFWGLGRLDETQAALRRIEEGVDSIGAGQRIRALQSAILLASGNLPQAYAMALPIAADPEADDHARLRAITAAGSGMTLEGRPQAALDLCESLLPVAFVHAESYPRGLGWVLAASLTALACLGRYAEAEQVLIPVREGAIVDVDEEVLSGSSLVLGRLALTCGDLVTAGTMTREALAVLRGYDTAGYLPWCLGMMAQVAGQLGDAAGARDALAELDQDDWLVRLQDHEVAIGRAWAAAAAGEIAAPVRILLDGAARARANGSRVMEGLVLQEALRLGVAPREVIGRLEACCATGGLPVHEVFLAHAVALGDDDGAALDAVADAFEGFAMMLAAAEASAEAVTAHRRAGLRARATRSAGNVTRLLVHCPGARTPVLARIVESPGLTRREREVSQLAARGLSNSDIAEQLSVSVRTVEGHLLRVSTKLGVRSRGDLESALGGAENA